MNTAKVLELLEEHLRAKAQAMREGPPESDDPDRKGWHVLRASGVDQAANVVAELRLED